jgi:disulfide bond formation protein DsbB
MGQASDRADQNWTILFVCWLLVSAATLGSLFFSEVMDLPPCTLCWYQRIFMFPLPIILLMGLFPFDARVVRYALPLALAGWAIAAYQTLLQLGVIPESAAPCSQGVSCSSAYLNLFGFVSIPVLSLLGFSSVIGLLLVLRRRVSG